MECEEKEVIRFARNLLMTNSVTGSEEEVATCIAQKMEKLGYDEVYIDDWGSVIGKIAGSGTGNSILFDGHMDTVDIIDERKWTHGPFAGEMVGGKLYGRGAADMKGALAAMVTGIGRWASGDRPKGDIYVTGTVMEEVAEGCALGHILDRLHPDVVVIGEATDLNLNIGQRGRGEILVTTRGKSAHSSNPKVGINAVYSMSKLIDRIRNIRVQEHEVLGKGILELTDIISTPYPGASVVPDTCKVTYDRRLLLADTKESILSDIAQEMDKLRREDPKFDGEVSVADIHLRFYTGKEKDHCKYAPAWCLDKEQNKALIDGGMKALREAGLDPKISSYQFCTNGSASAGSRGIPTIGFGPCEESQAHVIDEYILLEQLEKAEEGYYQLAGELAARP